MIRGFLAVLRRLRVPASSLPPASSHRGDNSIGVQEPRKLADVLDAKRPLWPQGNFDHLLYLAGILAGIDEFVDHAWVRPSIGFCKAIARQVDTGNCKPSS